MPGAFFAPSVFWGGYKLIRALGVFRVSLVVT